MALVFAWLASFIVLLAFIDKKYIRTFFSIKTAKHSARLEWSEAINDEIKMKIFKKPESYRKEIEEEVSIWMSQGFNRFVEQEWFTEKIFKTIPQNMLPEESMTAYFASRQTSSAMLIDRLSSKKRSVAEGPGILEMQKKEKEDAAAKWISEQVELSRTTNVISTATASTTISTTTSSTSVKKNQIQPV